MALLNTPERSATMPVAWRSGWSGSGMLLGKRRSSPHIPWAERSCVSFSFFLPWPRTACGGERRGGRGEERGTTQRTHSSMERIATAWRRCAGRVAAGGSGARDDVSGDGAQLRHELRLRRERVPHRGAPRAERPVRRLERRVRARRARGERLVLALHHEVPVQEVRERRALQRAVHEERREVRVVAALKAERLEELQEVQGELLVPGAGHDRHRVAAHLAAG